METQHLWRKEGYHQDLTKSSLLPDDVDDVTEFVELLAMLHVPGDRLGPQAMMPVALHKIRPMCSKICDWAVSVVEDCAKGRQGLGTVCARFKMRMRYLLGGDGDMI